MPPRSRKNQPKRGAGAAGRRGRNPSRGKKSLSGATNSPVLAVDQQGTSIPSVQLGSDGNDCVAVSDGELDSPVEILSESAGVCGTADVACVSIVPTSSQAGNVVLVDGVAANQTVSSSSSPRGKRGRGSRARRRGRRSLPFPSRAFSNIDNILLVDGSGGESDDGAAVASSSPIASTSARPASGRTRRRTPCKRTQPPDDMANDSDSILEGSDGSGLPSDSDSSYSSHVIAGERRTAGRSRSFARGRGSRKQASPQKQASPVPVEDDKDHDSWSDSSIEPYRPKDRNQDKPKSNDAKPKVRTDWSDDENLANQPILPEAAIFTNSIKAFSEELREFRKNEWLTKELIEAESGKSKRQIVQSDSSDDSNSNDEKDSSKTKKKSRRGDTADEKPVEAELSASAKKRIERKMKRLEEGQKKFLEFPPLRLGNSSSSSEDDLQCLSDHESNSEVIVKVRCQCDVLKIPLKYSEHFVKVFNEIAAKCNAKVTDVMLLLRDKTVTLEDTPKALNLMAGDILDCCIWNAKSEATNASLRKNYIRVQIQSNDSKTKSSFSIHKLEPLSIVMEKYAAERNVPLEKMIFKFDGEKIDPSSNSVDLDMEDESCIDVKLL